MSRGREDRTPINGFGDRRTTIVLFPYAGLKATDPRIIQQRFICGKKKIMISDDPVHSLPDIGYAYDLGFFAGGFLRIFQGRCGNNDCLKSESYGLGYSLSDL